MKKNICFVTATQLTVRVFLLDQIAALSKIYKVSVITNANDTNFLKDMGINAEILIVPINRKISLLKDIYALIVLFRLFRNKKFDIVHSVTPKAGLLSMIAGRFASIPVRIHTFTGQVWATRKGIMRLLLKNLDRLLVFFATHILVDSHSQREFLLAEKVVSSDKSNVLAHGSISGVDTERFCPNSSGRANIRKKLNINDNAIVFLFLGRLNKDKGVLDLAQAFSMLSINYNNVHLLFVGPDEENMKPQIQKINESYADKIHFVDLTNEPEHYMACADILCLPSYREGFGSVIIEAASSGIPAIGSRIYGVTDAVEEGITGLLHEAGNIRELMEKMKKLIENPELRNEMGSNARSRAHRNFSKEIVTSALVDYYRAVLR